MDSITCLISIAETYAVATGVERTTVSWRLFGDSKKLDALVSGSDIQVRRFEAALQWLSDNWPVGAIWPDQVARPQCSKGKSALAATLAPLEDDGAENLARNVSRTNEPGSSVAEVAA